MALSFEDFKRVWKDSGENQSDIMIDVAWRRYQQVQADDYVMQREQDDPTLEDLEAAFEPILQSGHMTCKYKFMTLPASNIPWTPTGIFVQSDQAVSIFSTGRTWRSKLLDLYLPPRFNLWFRIGVNGSIFNSTHDTKTFMSMDDQEGQELFVANQFPGSFSDKEGGRVGGNLSVYEKAEGAFQILIIVWEPGLSIHVDIRNAFQRLLRPADEATPIYDPFGLMSTGMDRLSSKYIIEEAPRGWTLLWFLGQSQIFYQEQDPVTAEDRSAKHELESVPESADMDAELLLPDPSCTFPMIRCIPSHNVGILQKDISPSLVLTPHTTTTWSWQMIDLPSRLREDTTISHDYFSLAFEFENGRDLTYTWSWELPVGFGYWCPLAAWCDREYHIVLRSGTEQLGQWVSEQRNIYQDYVEYVNGGDLSKVVPTQVVKVWLIAGNRWQRYRGEMLIKKVRLWDASIEGVEPLVLL
ncbi:hypothetical protein ES702_00607 [subsurface metagenome]